MQMNKNGYTFTSKQTYACFASMCKVIAIWKLRCAREQWQAVASTSWVHMTGKDQVGMLWNTARKLWQIAMDQIMLEAQTRCITNAFSGAPRKVHLEPAPITLPWKVCSSLGWGGEFLQQKPQEDLAPKTSLSIAGEMHHELVTTDRYFLLKLPKINKKKIQIL